MNNKTEKEIQQELFDKVVNHLIDQGGPSIAYEPDYTFPAAICKYRGGDGRSCAIGCLIKDEFYKEEFEGNLFTEMLHIKSAVEKSVGEILSSRTVELLRSLQIAHDKAHYVIDRWEWDDLKMQLLNIALKFGLDDIIILKRFN